MYRSGTTTSPEPSRPCGSFNAPNVVIRTPARHAGGGAALSVCDAAHRDCPVRSSGVAGRRPAAVRLLPGRVDGSGEPRRGGPAVGPGFPRSVSALLRGAGRASRLPTGFPFGRAGRYVRGRARRPHLVVLRLPDPVGSPTHYGVGHDLTFPLSHHRRLPLRLPLPALLAIPLDAFPARTAETRRSDTEIRRPDPLTPLGETDAPDTPTRQPVPRAESGYGQARPSPGGDRR